MSTSPQTPAERRAEAGLRLAGALQQFWLMRGYFAEGRERYATALSQIGAQGRTKERANALNAAGVLARMQGDPASARSLYEESLSIQQEIGNRMGIAASLGNLGNVAGMQGDYAAARAYYEQCLSICRELGSRQGIAKALLNLGEVAKDQGDYASARSLHEESLSLSREMGDRMGIAYSLESFASLAATLGMPERAAQLLGAAERLREEIAAPLPPTEREWYEGAVTAAQEAIGEAAFAAACEAGRKMTLEEAVAYALEEPRGE